MSAKPIIVTEGRFDPALGGAERAVTVLRGAHAMGFDCLLWLNTAGALEYVVGVNLPVATVKVPDVPTAV